MKSVEIDSASNLTTQVVAAIPCLNEEATVRKLYSYEEPTNAGIPTVGVTAEFLLGTANVTLKFRGSTPLGTSAGSGEAIHLVDSQIESAEYRELIDRHPSLFRETEPGVFAFGKDVSAQRVKDSAVFFDDN